MLNLVRGTWLFALLLLAQSVAAQQRIDLKGVVIAEDGTPLTGAEVSAPALRRGTISGANGRFTLSGVPGEGIEIRVARIGYAPTRVRLGAAELNQVDEPIRIILQSTPLTLPGMEVTATPTGRDPLTVAQATSQLSGTALEREAGAGIAQTLRTQPGVAVRFMGPAATMPVIRGLTGDRILMLQDGQRSGDMAGTADDHGVTIDPLAARRIEVVRGPATVLYGNNAVGGVVNVISGDIPISLPPEAEGVVSLQSESAFPGAAASGRMSAPLGDGWVVTARGAGRSTGEMRIPSGAGLGSRLANSDSRNAQGAIGIGRVGERGSAGVALRAFDFAYGVPVPPDADPVGLEGERYEVAARSELSFESPLLSTLELDATGQSYAHDEIDLDANEHLQEFELRTGTVDLVARHGGIGAFAEGAWGASLLLKRYTARGPEALTPPADSRGFGLFVFEELAPFGDRGVALQLGARYDHYRIESGVSEKFGAAHDRAFQAFSGAAAVRIPIASTVSASLHVGRSFRAPAVEELFSGAAHAGMGAVELGDAGLMAERGLSIEGMVRAHSARWNAQLSVHRNAINRYVHLALAGDTVLLGTTLPVLRYRQDDAVLMGAEGSVEWAATPQLVLGVMGDYLHAELADGTPLSYMPPPRLGLLARWEDGVYSLGADLHHELEQRRVGLADELPTEAHTTLRVHAGLRFRAGGRTHSITVRAENLGNELHREATSRIKDFAPGPGRNISVGYRLYY